VTNFFPETYRFQIECVSETAVYFLFLYHVIWCRPVR
jgi:hypothetical protein